MARKNGATEYEINEAVMIAMTIGAHKINLMAGKFITQTKKVSLPMVDTSLEETGFT